MRSRLLVGLVLALTVSVPTVAEAGAPNYECEAGPWRFGIDQHRRAGLIRFADQPAAQTMVQTSLLNGEQNGSSLNVTLVAGSTSLKAQVGKYGDTLSLTVVDGTNTSTYSGICAFVPGNFILGHVAESPLHVRTRASWNAPLLATAKRHSIVWSAAPDGSPSLPAPTTHGGWALIRVVSGLRGGSQELGIGATVGLDGPSTIAQGWGRVQLVKLVTAR